MSEMQIISADFEIGPCMRQIGPMRWDEEEGLVYDACGGARKRIAATTYKCEICGEITHHDPLRGCVWEEKNS